MRGRRPASPSVGLVWTYSNGMQLDHVVIAVRGLKASVAAFQQLGFDVVYGGTNGPTHNALIPFADGTYIEIIAIRSVLLRALNTGLLAMNAFPVVGADGRPGPVENRFRAWFRPTERMVDWCVRVEDMETALEACRGNGLSVHGPKAFARRRPDGVTPKWRLAGPVDAVAPFFIQDDTPTHDRIPSHDDPHPNGSIGIDALHIEVAGRDQAVTVLQSSVPTGLPTADGVHVQDVSVHVHDVDEERSGAHRVKLKWHSGGAFRFDRTHESSLRG